MQIQEIFKRNIARSINGVVKADQLNESVVWQELEEYVVTRELDEHFRKFLSAYLSAFDHSDDPTLTGREELRHYADMRIALDLDDGVKVNYGKFGGLLAETKAVTGQ